MNKDIYQIQQLAIRYAHYADTGRFADQASLFTPDGIWDASAVGLSRHEGADAIRAFMSGLSTTSVACAAHLVVNHLIEEDGSDSASGALYISSETRLSNGSIRFACTLVYDAYQRTQAGWRFKSRKLIPLLAPRMEPPEAAQLRG